MWDRRQEKRERNEGKKRKRRRGKEGERKGRMEEGELEGKYIHVKNCKNLTSVGFKKLTLIS